MMLVLLIAGLGLLLAGLLTAVFGFLIDLSFGNTLITSGAIIACTGIILLGLSLVVRELKNIARLLGAGVPVTSRSRTASQPAGAPRDLEPAKDELLFDRDQSAGNADPAGSSSAPAPWQQEVGGRDRGRLEAPALAEPAPPEPMVKPRRNLAFSSSSRKERERAQARAAESSADSSAMDGHAMPAAAPPPEPSPPPAATFEDAWPQSERARGADVPPQRRGARAPSTFSEANSGGVPADSLSPVGRVPRNQEQPPVTVLKSGVVDGMAYSLYSDGSIEAQMPEGMMRFASIDELRSHLDQRP